MSGLSEAELDDAGLNFLRTQLATVPGATIPYRDGGKPRQIMVDLDQRLLSRRGSRPPPRRSARHYPQVRRLVPRYQLLYLESRLVRIGSPFESLRSGSVSGRLFRGFETFHAVRKLLKEAPPWRRNCS
jgi:hypothetical protein